MWDRLHLPGPPLVRPDDDLARVRLQRPAPDLVDDLRQLPDRDRAASIIHFDPVTAQFAYPEFYLAARATCATCATWGGGSAAVIARGAPSICVQRGSKTSAVSDLSTRSTSASAIAAGPPEGYPKGQVADLIKSAERRGDIRYVRAEREGDGYKHLGASSLNAPPWAAPVARLRANPKIATPRPVFKTGKPQRFTRASVSAPGQRGDRRRRCATRADLDAIEREVPAEIDESRALVGQLDLGVAGSVVAELADLLGHPVGLDRARPRVSLHQVVVARPQHVGEGEPPQLAQDILGLEVELGRDLRPPLLDQLGDGRVCHIH